jgi:putative thioredoxin
MDATDETFYQQVLERSHERPVVVDFWAGWCGPCKSLAPVLEKAAGERPDIDLVKVDVDANRATADHYGIRGIPAVKAFRDGKVVAEFVGVQSPQSVEAFLDGLLGPTAGEALLEELRARGEDDLVALLERGDYEAALELLLGRAQASEGDSRDQVRRDMVALFEELGQDDPLSVRYRRALATALY